ncbi:MAG: PhzF family phenazine biosynthesis isomerase [Verrucomicrobia bacterium]|nr:PhzF family phenazine biosynthesis isomerase [Verrucomicrobiota bacterium]MBS0646870.1 PhzF family phenazine biosynthesis isomerase [Verrucomicrobiota bacterium]
MIKEDFNSLAQSLVNLFYPLVECSLLDRNGNILEIFNSFSSIKEDQQCDLKDFLVEEILSEFLTTGKNVRSLLYPFYKDKKIVSYLRVRYDLTHFKNLQDQLNFLIQPASNCQTQSGTDSWKQQIDQSIQVYLSENKISLQAMAAKQKRELISQLKSKSLFDFKESSAYVASKLQISRATVYNHLKTTTNFGKVHVHQVDAFTNTKFGGNPAGVVLDADDLDEITMRKIARELNLSETAFVLPSEKAAFKMRYFTPTGHEITFCGHSTVGALYMIAKEKRFGIEKEGLYPFKVETLCGVLNMEAKIENHDAIKVAYEAPSIHLKQASISHNEVAEAGGFDEHLINRAFPVMYEKTNKDLFVVANSLDALKKIECDPKTFAQFSKAHDIVALCVFCPETFDQENQFHMRCFAPLVGISEDPFTGSVLGGLTAYIESFELLPKDSNHFQVEQGHFIERPGVVRVEFAKKGKTYQAKIFAQAVHCFSTEINLI